MFSAGIAVFTSWNSFITLGLMGNIEHGSITAVRFVEGAPAGDTIKVTIKNTGAPAVNILAGYVNATKASNISPSQPIIPKGFSQELTLTYPKGTLVYGTQYQVKLVTAKGTSILFSLTYDSTCTSAYDPRVGDIIPTPRPLQAYELIPELKLSSIQAVGVFITSVIAAIAVVGACLLSNYLLHPKKKVELFVLLFFTTIIALFAVVAVVYPICFHHKLD